MNLHKAHFTILGAGTWGIALGKTLIQNNCQVSIWHYKPEYLDYLNQKKFHNNLNCSIPESINFISKHQYIDEKSCILICLPSQEIRKTLTFLKLKNVYYINASKGIELKTGKLISTIIKETTSANDSDIACISGPSHAEEVVQKIPTVIAVASKNPEFSKWVQVHFSNSFLRIYEADSIEAMQVGGSVKNIISIASGICIGLGYGDNTIAALITRGIQEIIRFSKIYTSNTKSLLGISGIGDLIVTATSNHSRNKSLGVSIGKGEKLDEISNKTNMITEGVETAKAVYLISKNNNISMPICDEVYHVLFSNKDPLLAIKELMSRDLRSE